MKALQEIMRMLVWKGAATGSPREILQLGYKIGFINDSEDVAAYAEKTQYFCPYL